MSIRTLLLAAAAVITLSATSCVRDYTCQCVIKYTGAPGLPDSVIKEYPIRDKKDKAEQLCKDNSHNSIQGGITTDERCELF